MKYIAVLLLISSFTACSRQPEPPAAAPRASQAAKPGVLQLSSPGDDNQLPGGGRFIWKFSEKPKLGTIIIKVQVFDKDGRQGTPYEAVGEFGMPSMPYHDSGPVKFQLNKKGDYLLPVNIVMAGEWQLLIRLKNKKDEVYAGSYRFNI